MANSFSCVIPFYNSKSTLGKTLDALVQDDRCPEIILVDDCSTDNTKEAIGRYLRDYPKVRYVRNERRLGAAAARNIGAGMAGGSILVFLDSDVVISRDSLKLLENYYPENASGPQQPDAVVANRAKEALCTDAVSLYKNYWTSYNLSKLQGWTYLVFSSFFVIRKSVFMDMGGFRMIPFAEDNDFGYRLILNNYKIYFAGEILAWHNKRFSICSLLRRELKAGREGIKVKLKNRMLGQVIRNKKFFVVNTNFIASFPFALLFSIGLILYAVFLEWRYLLVSASSALIIISLNREFLAYAACSKNSGRGIFYTFLMIAQMNAIGLGMFLGVCDLLITRLSGIALFLRHFLRGFFRLFVKSAAFPEQLTFFLTNRCNLNCRHCFVKRGETAAAEELKSAEIERVSAGMGRIKFITLTGGEPFLRDDIVDIVRILQRNLRPLSISIPTNGEMTGLILDNLKKILGASPDQRFLVKVSLDGPPEVHDRMRLKAGSFENARNTFLKLKGLQRIYPRLSLGIITTYTEQNGDIIEKFYEEVICNLQPDQYGISLQRPAEANALSAGINIDDFLETYERVHQKMRHFSRGIPGRFRLAYKISIAHKLKKIYRDRAYPIRCFAGTLNAVIAPNGDVFPCEQLRLKLGNLREAGYDWRRIWRSPEAARIRRSIGQGHCFCTNECYLPFNLSYDLRELLGVMMIFFGRSIRRFSQGKIS